MALAPTATGVRVATGDSAATADGAGEIGSVTGELMRTTGFGIVGTGSGSRPRILRHERTRSPKRNAAMMQHGMR